MTRPLACPLSPDLVQLIADQRLDGLLTWTRSGLHHAMHAEHSPDLNAPWHARTAERRGAAPGYQPTTVTPRSGKVTFDVPQVCDGRLYPQVLEPRLQNACARGRWPPFSEKGGHRHALHGTTGRQRGRLSRSDGAGERQAPSRDGRGSRGINGPTRWDDDASRARHAGDCLRPARQRLRLWGLPPGHRGRLHPSVGRPDYRELGRLRDARGRLGPSRVRAHLCDWG